MESNKHPLGWLPDYPDLRDRTMNGISQNIVKDQPKNQESTESSINQLANKFIEIILSSAQSSEQNFDRNELKIKLDSLLKENDNEFDFIPVKRENIIFLYKGSRNDKIRDIQRMLQEVFYDELSQGSIRDYSFSEGTRKILNDQRKNFEFESEIGYFGEATDQIITCFKKIWEIPSENSIIDCDINSEENDQDQEEENYEYKLDMTIYKVLKTINNRLKRTEADGHIKIGDCDSQGKLEICKIKKHLKDMGYFDFLSKEDKANDEESKHFFGYKTDLVVEFFQGINNLYPDGIVGKYTKQKLGLDNPDSPGNSEEIINLDDKSTTDDDLHQKLDGNPMVYIQRKLRENFGRNNKINGKPDDKTTIDAINDIFGLDHVKITRITVSSLKKLLERIIEKAENLKQYSLPQTSNIHQENTEFSKHKSCSSRSKQYDALLEIQEPPIPENIIKIFTSKLKLKLTAEPEIKIEDKDKDILYPVIKLVIKKISDLGIHGQLDYEQAISQAINVINIILDKEFSSSSKKGDSNDESKKDKFSINSNNNNFYLAFIQQKNEEISSINLSLFYESLSEKDKQEIKFLILIALDQISFMGDSKKEENRLIRFSKQAKESFIKKYIKQKKSRSAHQNLDENPSNYEQTNNLKNNNHTILQVCPLDQTKSPGSSSKPEQLSILVRRELKKRINISQNYFSPVYLCLPEFVDLSYWCSPVKNQEPLNSCTACAAITLVEYFQNRTADKYTNASVLFLYKVARKLMHRQGDVGASIRETMKAMVLFGIPPEEYWPYEPSKVDEEPTGFCYSYAQNYQAIQYFRLDTPGLSLNDLLAQIKMALVAGLPSMFGLTIYSSIYEDANYKKGYIPKPNPLKDRVEGGHALVAVGYDDYKIIGDSVGGLLVINSWGTKWGEKGYGWLPYDYIIQGLTSDWWSLIKAEWFETMNFGSGAPDLKNNGIGTVPDKHNQPGSNSTPSPSPSPSPSGG